MTKPILGALLCIAALPAIAQADAMTSFELDGTSTNPMCILSMETHSGARVAINIYDSVPSLNVFVGGVPERFEKFFTHPEYIDDDKWNDTFQEIMFGGKTFAITDTSLWETTLSRLDEDSEAYFEVEARHNVVAVLEAMESPGLSIPGLISLGDTGAAFGEFRTCAYQALGLEVGERVERDMRVEYRMLFEKSFEHWNTYMALAQGCLQGRVDDDQVEEIIDRAAAAFHPGLWNMRVRSTYADRLRGEAAMARFGGSVDAMSGDCMGAGMLVDMAYQNVESVLQSAEDLD